MEPISALPGCVLQMTLKSSCSQTAFPCLSLRGNSEECDRCGSVPAVCVSAGESGREEGRETRACSFSLTFPSLLPNSLIFIPAFWQLLCHRVSPAVAPLWLAPFPHSQHLSNTDVPSTSTASPTCQSSKTCWLTRSLFILLGLEQPKQDICQSQSTVSWP